MIREWRLTALEVLPYIDRVPGLDSVNGVAHPPLFRLRELMKCDYLTGTAA